MRTTLCLAATLLAVALPALAEAEVLHPKVVIVAYFEDAAMAGEPAATGTAWGSSAGPPRPGELHTWVEREHLTRRIAVPGAFNPVWANADGSVIAMKVGPNSLHPAVNLTALGLDPQFDLTRSYWLFTGIAGISPTAGTLGDAVWTDFVVNGDAGHEIDAREIPADWTTGYLPPGKTRPYEQPRVAKGSPDDVSTWNGRFHTSRARNVVALNRGLARWAYAMTRDVVPADTADMRRARAAYTTYPTALGPPSVRLGATLSAETFWHGKVLNRWAHDWVAYLTDGQAAYVTTETNDSGAMVGIAGLAAAGKADPNRVLLLRTASNFDMPPEGITAAADLADAGPGSYAAYLPALETAYGVVGRVVHEIAGHWDRYRDAVPTAPTRAR